MKSTMFKLTAIVMFVVMFFALVVTEIQSKETRLQKNSLAFNKKTVKFNEETKVSGTQHKVAATKYLTVKNTVRIMGILPFPVPPVPQLPVPMEDQD